MSKEIFTTNITLKKKIYNKWETNQPDLFSTLQEVKKRFDNWTRSPKKYKKSIGSIKSTNKNYNLGRNQNDSLKKYNNNFHNKTPVNYDTKNFKKYSQSSIKNFSKHNLNYKSDYNRPLYGGNRFKKKARKKKFSFKKIESERILLTVLSKNKWLLRNSKKLSASNRWYLLFYPYNKKHKPWYKLNKHNDKNKILTWKNYLKLYLKKKIKLAHKSKFKVVKSPRYMFYKNLAIEKLVGGNKQIDKAIITGPLRYKWQKKRYYIFRKLRKKHFWKRMNIKKGKYRWSKKNSGWVKKSNRIPRKFVKNFLLLKQKMPYKVTFRKILKLRMYGKLRLNKRLRRLRRKWDYKLTSKGYLKLKKAPGLLQPRLRSAWNVLKYYRNVPKNPRCFKTPKKVIRDFKNLKPIFWFFRKMWRRKNLFIFKRRKRLKLKHFNQYYHNAKLRVLKNKIKSKQLIQALLPRTGFIAGDTPNHTNINNFMTKYKHYALQKKQTHGFSEKYTFLLFVAPNPNISNQLLHHRFYWALWQRNFKTSKAISFNNLKRVVKRKNIKTFWTRHGRKRTYVETKWKIKSTGEKIRFFCTKWLLNLKKHHHTLLKSWKFVLLHCNLMSWPSANPTVTQLLQVNKTVIPTKTIKKFSKGINPTQINHLKFSFIRNFHSDINRELLLPSKTRKSREESQLIALKLKQNQQKQLGVKPFKKVRKYPSLFISNKLKLYTFKLNTKVVLNKNWQKKTKKIASINYRFLRNALASQILSNKLINYHLEQFRNLQKPYYRYLDKLKTNSILKLHLKKTKSSPQITRRTRLDKSNSFWWFYGTRLKLRRDVSWISHFHSARSFYTLQRQNENFRQKSAYNTKRYAVYRTFVYLKSEIAAYEKKRDYRKSRLNALKVILPVYGGLKLKKIKQMLKSFRKIKSHKTGPQLMNLATTETSIYLLLQRLNWAPNTFWAKTIIKNGWVSITRIKNVEKVKISKLYPLLTLTPYSAPLNANITRNPYYKLRTNEVIQINPNFKLYIKKFFVRYKIFRKQLPNWIEINSSRTSATITNHVVYPITHTERTSKKFFRFLLT